MITAVPEVLERLGLPPALHTQPMSGYDAQVWRAELADGRVVAVRVLRPGVPADGEVAALRLARATGQPAPDVLGVGEVDGRAAVVMTWCRGRPIGDLLRDGGDPDQLGHLFGRAHAGLHRAGADTGEVLCHLDFQPFNVLVEGDAVTGIVDWSNARLADPRSDLAWTRVVLAFAPALVPEFAGGIARFESAWRAGYTTVRPMPDDAELRPFLAAAARKQVEDWAPRAASGACPAHVLDVARAVAQQWDG